MKDNNNNNLTNFNVNVCKPPLNIGPNHKLMKEYKMFFKKFISNTTRSINRFNVRRC